LELPHWLEENGYTYAIRFTPNVATKRMALKDGEAASYPCEKSFMIVRVDDDNQ
jgi:hypothetical protein